MIDIAIKINKAPVQDHEIHEVFRVVTAGINSDFESGELVVNGDAGFGTWEMSLSDRKPLQAAEDASQILIQATLSEDALESDRDVENIMDAVRKGVNSGDGGGPIEIYGAFLGEWEISYAK